MRPTVAVGAALLVAVARSHALGQDTTRVAPDSALPTPTCVGQLVTTVDVQPEPPRMIGRSAPAWRRLILKAVFQHETTKPDVVTAFLRLKPGDRCTEFRRTESERLLRAQPFIAAASVRAVPDTGTGARIEVETIDEIPLVLDASIRGGGVSSFAYGNANIAGRGIYASARWEQGDAYRDGLGGRFHHYHMFGRPYRLTLSGARNPLGHDVLFSLGQPFHTNLQRTAWHAGVSTVRSYQTFVRRGAPSLSLQLDRTLYDLGWVARVGAAGYGAFLGALATHERVTPAAEPVVITDTGLASGDGSVLRGRYEPYRNFRLSAAFGLRLLDFMTARGFDALAGEQDVATGIQIGALVGRSFRGFDATDRGTYVSLDTYVGAGSPRSFLGLRVEGEGRHDQLVGRWNAIVASGRLAWYRKPSERRTLIASAEFSGGWRERLPLQLTLGDRAGGLRGFRGSTVAGGRRFVFRLEPRRVMGNITSRSLWGLAAFADAGKTWAGNVPFGETTALRASLGGSLLLAVPAQSRRLLRLDVAFPVTTGAPDRWTLRVWAGSASRTFWREPGDVARVRAGAPPSSIFSWP